jgi:CRP-like cAMP-binding protein
MPTHTDNGSDRDKDEARSALARADAYYISAVADAKSQMAWHVRNAMATGPLTAAEVAEYLGCSRRTVFRLLAAPDRNWSIR